MRVKLAAWIEMELLSETIFGGDNKAFSTTDIDIQTDEQGFPYFSGRTLKGVLREEAEWYNQCLPEDRRMNWEIERLFGKGHSDNYEGLRIGSAKLSDTLYDFVRRERISPQQVTQALTDVRSMTAISDEGKAVKGTLRNARVIKPGFVFIAPVFVAGPLTDKEKHLLETAVKLVRRVGVMRHRGKGEVRCRLRWVDASAKQAAGWRQPSSYYELTIHVHEPLKISHVLGTSDSSHALKYIPGSVLRGALVQEYLQSAGLAPELLDTSFVFNPTHVQFWNGYLSHEGKRGLPFAMNMFETKESAKTNASMRNIYDAFDEARFQKIQHQSPVRVTRDVMFLQDGREIMAGNVKTVSSLHISINGTAGRTTDGETHVYRYEAIAPGQTFKAVVYVSEDHSFARWLAEQSELTLWLGGARNSGYGRTTVHVKPLVQSPEHVDVNRLQAAEQLYVLATSDWIIRDEHGRLVSALDEKWLGQQLGVELEWMDQLTATRVSGGYVSPWKAYQPAVQAIQAGSIFRYRIKSGKLNPEKLAALMERGVGDRVNEGYGRLMFFADWTYQQLKDVSIPRDEGSKIARGSAHADAAQLEKLKESLIRMHMYDAVRLRVAQWRERVSGGLNSSKWGKLWQVASEMLWLAQLPERTESPLERWDRFWKDVENRTKNKSKWGMFGVKVDDMHLGDFVRRQLDIPFEIPAWYQGEVDHLHWNLRALELFFRQMLRDKSVGNARSDAG